MPFPSLRSHGSNAPSAAAGSTDGGSARERGTSRQAPALRRAFTLVEIVAVLAILGVLSTVVYFTIATSAAQKSDTDRINNVAKILNDLSRAIAFFEPTRTAFSFHQTIGVYPGRLSHLTTAITTTQQNSCGAVYTSGNVTAWTGGYYARELPPSGFLIDQGFTSQDSLVRTPPNAGGVLYGTLAIVIPAVSASDAKLLAVTVDGDSTGTVGTVRFTLNGSNPVTVSYLTEVGGC